MRSKEEGSDRVIKQDKIQERIGLVTTVGLIELIFALIVIPFLLMLTYGCFINRHLLQKKTKEIVFITLAFLLVLRMTLTIIGLFGGIYLLRRKN